jgi:hypothetical protein
MYLTQNNGALWKSWPDFSSWNLEERLNARSGRWNPCGPSRNHVQFHAPLAGSLLAIAVCCTQAVCAPTPR